MKKAVHQRVRYEETEQHGIELCKEWINKLKGPALYSPCRVVGLGRLSGMTMKDTTQRTPIAEANSQNQQRRTEKWLRRKTF